MMFRTSFLLVYYLSVVGSISLDSSSKKRYTSDQRYVIRGTGITYTQYTEDNGQCRVEINGKQWLNESQLIQAKNRWFKVEDCRLNRAYAVTCGSKLFDRLRFIACSLMDQVFDAPVVGRRWRRNKQINAAKLDPSTANVCCEKACTMTDLAQYCSVQ